MLPKRLNREAQTLSNIYRSFCVRAYNYCLLLKKKMHERKAMDYKFMVDYVLMFPKQNNNC